jgi:hypothetical protein
MTADRHFDDVLAELGPYLDNPPLPDSPERLRLEQLIAEVGRLAALGHQHHIAEQIARSCDARRRAGIETRGQPASS